MRFAAVGESLHMIDVRGGRVTLTPVSLWEVHGDDGPGQLDLPLYGIRAGRLPDWSTLPADRQCLHFRYSPSPVPTVGRTFTRGACLGYSAGSGLARKGHKRKN